MNVLLGVTGSVAAIKLDALVAKLLEIPNSTIKVVLTKSAHHFVKDSLLLSNKNSTSKCAKEFGVDNASNVVFYSDNSEYDLWSKRGDLVLHIELRKWADILVIAPLSANTLAKMALGLTDNLLTSVVRAWDLNKHMVLALAMNTSMYLNKLTKEHENKIKFVYGNDKVVFVEPASKKLMCGDEGIGAMASVDTLYERILDLAPKIN